MEAESAPRRRLRAALTRRLPVLGWAARYSRGDALADAVAGVTLGLTLVPQSIAYAALAGRPVQYGLYSSFVGTMLYVLLGTVKEVSIGPTSLMALLTLQTVGDLPVEYMVLLTFLSGALVFAMGLLRLGFLVELISPSVTSGFTSATALIIVASQLKGLLGVSFVAESLLENVRQLAAHAPHARPGDMALGAACCAALLLLRKLKDLPVGPKRARLRRALWLVSIARNALVVLGAALLAYVTRAPGQPHPYFKLSGRVEPGLPRVALPAFSVSTGNGTEGFTAMAARLAPGVLLLPVVMVLANIAIAKAFSGGGRVDATQEMLTLGLCNMAGALVQAMPACGAFTRSAVSHSSGVRTPLAGLYSGLVALGALAFMTQYFYYIPRASLSAVLICAVIFMIDFSTVRRLWVSSRAELGVLLLTVCVALLAAVELALLAGALGSLALVLRRLMRPHIHTTTEKSADGAVRVVRVWPALLYLNAEHVGARLLAAACAAPPAPAPAPRALLLDAAGLALVDQAAVESLERLIKKLEAGGRRLVVFNAAGEALPALRRVRGLDARALAARSAAAALASAAPPPPADAAAAPLLRAPTPPPA